MYCSSNLMLSLYQYFIWPAHFHILPPPQVDNLFVNWGRFCLYRPYLLTSVHCCWYCAGRTHARAATWSTMHTWWQWFHELYMPLLSCAGRMRSHAAMWSTMHTWWQWFHELYMPLLSCAGRMHSCAAMWSTMHTWWQWFHELYMPLLSCAGRMRSRAATCRGKSGPALGCTEYRLMPSVCRLIVR